VDDDHEIGCSSEPNGPALVAQNTQVAVLEIVAVGPVANEGHREVAKSDDSISQLHSSPHRDPGRLLRSRWQRGLNLQRNIVSCIRECHSAQRVEDAEYVCPCMRVVKLSSSRCSVVIGQMMAMSYADEPIYAVYHGVMLVMECDRNNPRNRRVAVAATRAIAQGPMIK